VIATAAGIHRVVNARMADQIRLVTIKRGYDPRGFTLVVLGGAGPVHGAALADEIGMLAAKPDLDGLKDDELGRGGFTGRTANIYRRHDPTAYRASGPLRPVDVPPLLAHAVVAVEDERFFVHHGLDTIGTARAVWDDVTGMGTPNSNFLAAFGS